MSYGEEEKTTSALRAPRPADHEPVRHRRRRPTRKWCKGIVGREHNLIIRLKVEWLNSQRDNRVDRRLPRWPDFDYRPGECQWLPWGWRRGQEWHYACGHQRVCTECGKILVQRVRDKDCPYYHPPRLEQDVVAKQPIKRRHQKR